MSIIGEKSLDWRDEHGMRFRPLYKKRWALKPMTCSDGTAIWLQAYYAYFKVWSTEVYGTDDGYEHTDFIENITEAEYIVRKLADNL